MAITNSFESFILDQLSHLGSVHSKRMFGGAGLYVDDVMFAILADDVLYLKIDDRNRQDFEDAGLRSFQPYPDKSTVMSYREAPPEVLENRDSAADWVGKALEVARSAKKQSRGKRKRLRNIGPKSTVWLEKVGIRTLDELKNRGVVRAFLDIRATGQPVTMNLLYSLQGAVMNMDWRDIPPDIKAGLRRDVAL